MSKSALFISSNMTEKGIIKEFETYLRVNRGMDIRFDIVNDTDTAFKVLNKSAYDLVMIDLDEVTVSPNYVLNKIKSLSSSVLLALTSDLNEETGIFALENGADDIIYKPIRHIEFWIKVSNLVKMRSYQEQLEEEKGILKKFVSEEIAEHVMKNEQSNAIKTYATVLFFDIRDSTALAETISPLELADLLNDIMNHVIDVIYKNLGSVNNILGDGILATFGYPVVYDFDAVRAVQCIQDIRVLFETHKFSRPIRYGIGVTTGAMFSGNIGNSHKMSCTVLGDSVNTASRLENLTKKAEVDSLIDETTYQAASKYIKVKKFRSKVRGKADLLNSYHPIEIDTELMSKDLAASNEVINTNIAGIGDIEYL